MVEGRDAAFNSTDGHLCQSKGDGASVAISTVWQRRAAAGTEPVPFRLIRRGSEETGLEHTPHANDPAASVRTEPRSRDCSTQDEPTQGNIWVKNCELPGRVPAVHWWADWKLVTIR